VIDIERNLVGLRERIAAAAARAARDPEEVTLVAVTKTVSPTTIEEAVNAGLTELGENRVQEAEAKIQWFQERGVDLRWHLVGHLQRNKARKAIDLFQIIHSVDSVRLARELSRRCEAAQTTMPVFLEVNVSGEVTKYGFVTQEGNEEQELRLFRAVEQIVALPNLEVQGLMTMAPYGAPEEVARSCFRRLNRLRSTLEKKYSQTTWRHLSMGMTDDFEPAIEEGATIIRVGRAIFGERNIS
jgi:pyridoxal phosphate enzyme (YggS family)